ncbi:hypothetical protein WJX72_003136 [[Myrmecia] bisecta]|uniref:Uncharacterized protein n=1 Tax=[Myrmecia] bisecta TaxID=41462 RepID=A0AAW1Q1D3_9CHLO
MDAAAALESLKSLYKSQETSEDDRGVGGDESVSEALSKEVFSTYQCRSIGDRGVPHPGSIAEATSLSAIPLPVSTYPLWDSIPADLVSTGKLSQLQLEGVLYACTKHLEFLPSGERAGFFIGDGAGVGKGRQIAGIILDNYARGRRRHVWLSTSSDLHHDAERDLRNLGCHINVINNCQTLDKETRALGLPKDFQEGVLFLTYSTLISNVKGRTRLQQVVDWLGGPEAFDGLICFDECHKAKNFVPGKEAQSTKVATAVLELQKVLPRARIVYCSATGVSEVGNMAYMTRLGLWGPGSAFSDFEAFLDSMKKRGVSFMEMLAMEMKSEGYYVARGLSFRDAEFMELECKLAPEQVEVYDRAVDLWQDLRREISSALDKTGSTNREVWKPFWSAAQRFFKLLCISLKIPRVVQQAQHALAEGCAVVIGLQTTGEAAADSMGLEPGQVCGFVSTTKEMVMRFVQLHFPTRFEVNTANVSQGVPASGALEEPSCVAAKEALLERTDTMVLPPNFLDEVVDELGGPKAVAEMTGRKGRIVRDSRGHGVYQLRAKPDSTEMDSLNVMETGAFMRGEKVVAIVSDAASTGISLHASREVANQRRRVHLTIELPWSADKAIQQLGRSHRSNQVTGPIYMLCVTNLGGEKRFAAAVARRLQSLGALTRGDRRAASGIDLSESNFDSPLGRKSLRRMYDCIVQDSPLLPSGVTLPAVLEGCNHEDIEDILASLPTEGVISAAALITAVQKLHARLRDCVDLMGIGVGLPCGDTVAEEGAAAAGPAAGNGSNKDMGDVRRFLNRLLGLPVARQNLLFNYFACTLTAEIRAAKAEGRYHEGVSDLSGSHTKKPKPQVLWVDHYTGLETLRNDLVMDRGMSFEAACARLEHEGTGGDASGFRCSKRPMFGRVMYILAIQKAGHPNIFNICRPNTGASYFDMEIDELSLKYKRADLEEVREGWEEVYQSSLTNCMHGPNCTQGPECQVGRRLTDVTIVSGSVVRVWGALESTLARHEGMLSKSDRTMRVVRVDFGDGSHLVGVRYPAHLLPQVVATLASAQALISQQQLQLQQQQAGGGPGSSLQQQALQAAAMGAGGAIRVEPVSPVDKKSLAKALRPPRTMLSFFKPKSVTPTKRREMAALAEMDPKGDPSDPHHASAARIKPVLSHSASRALTQPAAKRPRIDSAQPCGHGTNGGTEPTPSAANGAGRPGAVAAAVPSTKPAAQQTANEEAVRALKVTQGNVERAANWVLSGM